VHVVGLPVELDKLVWNHCNETDLTKAQRADKTRRVQAIHAKIANTIKVFLHKETMKIADTFELICDGNVSARWLQATNGKSAAGASTGLSRQAIARGARFADNSEFLRIQTCSDCKSVGGPNFVIGEWTCRHCGSVHDRDANAARTIIRLEYQAPAAGSGP
jgi:transposase